MYEKMLRFENGPMFYIVYGGLYRDTIFILFTTLLHVALNVGALRCRVSCIFSYCTVFVYVFTSLDES